VTLVYRRRSTRGVSLRETGQWKCNELGGFRALWIRHFRGRGRASVIRWLTRPTTRRMSDHAAIFRLLMGMSQEDMNERSASPTFFAHFESMQFGWTGCRALSRNRSKERATAKKNRTIRWRT
jgi:hypothetical protein